ncbi:hypothetical protein KM043_014492 [Ampulex compressa]|nr:hypothetical protein KM043_014492 [Ampulex compressa]
MIILRISSLICETQLVCIHASDIACRCARGDIRGRPSAWQRSRRVKRVRDVVEVGHHVNCIPDCGLLKSGGPPPVHSASSGRPQTGSNKPSDHHGAGSVCNGTATSGDGLGYDGRTVPRVLTANPLAGENLRTHPAFLTSPLTSTSYTHPRRTRRNSASVIASAILLIAIVRQRPWDSN